ncbi:hypothetical protein [Georgenia sp. SUBG003]|uniref:hypothetical protein n=1 Tax=Georgenia sp. SUBG003 TaxID=1497974 RepID=UPI003AB8D236
MYVNGDRSVEAAVLRIRWRLIAPALIVAGVAGGVLYAALSGIAALPVILGGLTVAFNNLAELESARLQKQLATVSIARATLVSRSAGLFTIIVNGQFSWAMLVCGVLYFAALAVSARATRTRSRTEGSTFRSDIRTAYQGGYMSTAILDVIGARSPFLVAPLAISPVQAGAFSALLSAQKSVVSVLTATLYTVMATRSTTRSNGTWTNSLERLVAWCSLLLGLLGFLLTDEIFAVLNLPQDPEIRSWWALFMASVPVSILVRLLQYRLMATSRSSRAAYIALVSALGTAIFLGLSYLTGETLLLAMSPLVGELLALSYGLTASQLFRAQKSRL